MKKERARNVAKGVLVAQIHLGMAAKVFAKVVEASNRCAALRRAGSLASKPLPPPAALAFATPLLLEASLVPSWK